MANGNSADCHASGAVPYIATSDNHKSFAEIADWIEENL